MRFKIEQLQNSKNESAEHQLKIDTLTQELHDSIVEASQKRTEKDLRMQDDHKVRVDMRRFWRDSTDLMSKSAYVSERGVKKTDSELEYFADKLDSTFTQDYSERPLDFEAYKQITPDKTVQIKSEPAFINDTISDMSKIDSFYKKFSFELSRPISILINLIHITQYFPDCLKITKCTMLPDRAIFSLPALPKIVETVIKKSIDQIKTEDGTMQMAYTPARGTTLCNAITLWKVECCKEPTIQNQADMVKAFNSVRVDSTVNEAQSKYGYGKMFKSILTNRRYSFNGKMRGKSHNSGVPAGTIMGVEAFMLFVATCEALTGLNRNILWPSLFADDASPLAALSYVKSGGFQRDLIRAFQWSKLQGVNFHLTGKKKPKFFAFLKRGQEYPDEFDELYLGDTALEKVDEAKQLGLIIRTRPKAATKVSKQIDRYGYEVMWNVPKIKSISYRFRDKMEHTHPENTINEVGCYLGGELRYSSCLKWLRGSENDRATVTFYYAQAIIFGLFLDVLEIMGLSCCKSLKINPNTNSKYKELLEYSGLPSLRMMAAQDAYNTIIQWHTLMPELFIQYPKRELAILKRNKEIHELPKGVTREHKKNLLGEMFSLAKEFENKLRSDQRNSVERAKNKLPAPKVPFVRDKFSIRKQLEDRKEFTFLRYRNAITTVTRTEFKCIDTGDLFVKKKLDLQVEKSKQNGEWIYPTHRKRKIRESNSPVIEPIEYKFGRFEILRPKETEPISESHIIEMCNKDANKKTIKKKKKSNKRMKGKSKSRNHANADYVDEDTILEENSMNIHAHAGTLFSHHAHAGTNGHRVSTGNHILDSRAYAENPPDCSTPKRKNTDLDLVVPLINSLDTPTKKLKLATPSILKTFKRICTTCSKEITTQSHYLTECTAIPTTPNSNPVSKNVANRRCMPRLKRALKMSSKLDFG